MAVLSKPDLKRLLLQQLPDNSSGEVSVADVRQLLNDIVDSLASDTAIAGFDVRSLQGMTVSGRTLTLTFTDAADTAQTISATLPDAGGQAALTRPTFIEIRDGTGQTIRGWAVADVHAAAEQARDPDYDDAADGATGVRKVRFSAAEVANVAGLVVNDSVEQWARDTETPIPTDKLSNAPQGSGGSARTDAEINALIEANKDVVSAVEFEQAFRVETPIITN